MNKGPIFVVAMAMVLAPVVLGTNHLSFSSANVSIARPGCGVTKLCVESPDDCDPAGSSPCLFFSVNSTGPSPPGGFDLAVQLRGDSGGYVALGLTDNATMGTSQIFACAAQNSGTFFFRTREQNNNGGGLTPTERIVRDIRGTVSGSVIQCEFTIPMANASNGARRFKRHSHFSTFMVLLGTGAVDAAGNIGAFNVTFTQRLNLNDPTSDGRALQSQAVLVMLGALAYLLS